MQPCETNTRTDHMDHFLSSDYESIQNRTPHNIKLIVCLIHATQIAIALRVDMQRCLRLIHATQIALRVDVQRCHHAHPLRQPDSPTKPRRHVLVARNPHVAHAPHR